MSKFSSAWEAADFETIAAEKEESLLRREQKTIWRESRAALELEALVVNSELTENRKSSLTRHPKVVTILHASLPHHVGGYTGRAQGLLKGLVEGGANVVGYTRPGFLKERISSKLEPPYADDVVDGVVYKHSDSSFPRKRGEYRYMLECVEYYRRVFDIEAPNIVHVRSTYLIALPAMIAAHQLGIPVVYEVSGLWELVFEGRGDTGRANRIKRMEDLTVSCADRVVTMNKSMASLLQRRNPSVSTIGLVPNAVDCSKATQISPLTDERNYEYQVGYIGSMVDYEGLDILLQAISILRAQGFEIKAKIVGDGAERKSLTAMSKNLGLSDLVDFVGRVPASEAMAQFENVNVIVLPRKSTPATECVTPLKPFEAMAVGRPLIVSSVSALKELSNGGANACVFEESNPEALAKCIRELLDDRDWQNKLVESGRKLVENEHSWPRVAAIMNKELEDYARPSSRLPILKLG